MKKESVHSIYSSLILCIVFFFASLSVSSVAFCEERSLPNLHKYYKNIARSLTFASEVNTQEKFDTIRIGYKGNYGVIKSPSVQGYEGYGYEYINEIFKYMGKSYRPLYIEVDWSEGLEMLENGDLDFLVGANYTTERERKFIYVEEEFCKDTLFLVSLGETSSRIDFGNFEKLQGSHIAIQKGDAMAPVFYRFLKERNIQANITEVDFGSIKKVQALNEYDFALSGSMQMDSNLNIVVSFDRNSVYIIANKDKQELVDDFNKATDELLDKDYLFKERLFIKYFDNAYTRSEYVSRDDLTLFRQKDAYVAGAVNLNSPLSYKNSDDKIAGIYVDILHFIEEIADVDIKLIEITPHTSDEILEKIDFSLLPRDESRDLDLVMSRPLINLPYVLVEKKIQLHNEILGTLDYYDLTPDDINYFIQNQTIVEYGAASELIRAFNEGKITNMFLTAANFSSLRSEITVKGYRITNVDYRFAPAISFSPSFSQEKACIFDKLLTHITNFDIADSVAHNVAILNSKDEQYYLYKYRYVIIAIFFLIVFIAIIMMRYHKLQKAREIKKLKDFDKLTGLFTYDKFVEEVRKILDNYPEHEYKILSADIDNFRYINEIYGYDTGSEILRHVGYFIKNNMQAPLPIALHSGDNFLVLINSKRVVDKYDLVDRLDNLVLELERFVGKNYNFSFSVGLYEVRDRDLDVNFMIDCANVARAQSKTSFGTSIEFYNDAMKQNYVVKNEILSHLKSAFENREFRLFYQPKFNINTMEIVGAEALIRWFQGDKMIPPDNFIPVLEGNGLIDKLDYYVVDAACRFIRANEVLGLPKISINVSGHTIVREEVVAKIIEITRQYGIDPSKLDMEITESALVDNFNQSLDKINTLRSLGFTVSMDDFGAGISSLNRLSSIPIDILKIDRGFIVDALENRKGAAIIKNVIHLAKDIYVETVAEGIETIEQLDFLRNLGCDVGQGYYFSRPVSGKDFIDLLIKDREELTQRIEEARKKNEQPQNPS